MNIEDLMPTKENIAKQIGDRETFEANQIEKNLNLLEKYFVEHVDEGRASLDDDLEESLNRWLEITPYQELRAIINHND